MPKDDLFPEEPLVGLKPPDPDAITPTGVNEQGLTEDDESMASPAEQAQYEQIQVRAREIIHGPKRAMIIEKLNDPRRPVHETVGDVAAQIGGIIIGIMKNSNETPDLITILSAAEDFVIPELFEVGEAAGVFPKMSEQEEQREMQMALLHAQSVYGNKMAREGQVPTNEAQEVISDQLNKEGGGYSFDQFVKDADASEGQSIRQPQGGPPSQLKPLANFSRNSGTAAATPGSNLFNG